MRSLNPIDTALFKYIEAPFHENLLNRGEILVGTLRKYKDIAEFNEHRKDLEEGECTTYQTYDRFDYAPETFKRAFGSLVSVEGCRDITFANCSVKNIFPNCLVFSLSAHCNEPSMKATFGENCFWLTNLEEIVGRMTKALDVALGSIKLQNPVIGEVVYRSREIHYKNSDHIPPCWIKDPVYSKQREYRIIWMTSEPETLESHYIIRDPEFKKLFFPI